MDSVATTIYELLNRPHHRQRWESWTRPGVRGTDEDGAQTCIAWVVENYRYDDAKESWKEPSSSPSSRSAVQRLFRQGASAVPNATPEMTLRQMTRSRILSDIVAAFEIESDELDEIRASFQSSGGSGSAHMGPAFHSWELSQTDDDLKAVIQLSRRVIGGYAGFKADANESPTFGDIAPVREQLSRRPDAIELCIRNEVDGDIDTLVGYTLAYPVNSEAASGLMNGTMKNAADIGLERIATRAIDEAALYIGMVLGSDLSARASVMDRAINRWTAWATLNPDSHFFAKRSTGDGQRWLEKYGFTPVASEDEIWVRPSSMPLIQPRRRRIVAAAV